MPRLTPDDVACWLLKSSGVPADLAGPGGGPRRLSRCLRRSYRLDLMSAGQPVLLWVSGREEPGVRAVGVVAGPVDADGVVDIGDDDVVEVDLVTLRSPVRRGDLLLDDRFRTAEVVRMAAGSNPSHLTRRQLEAVLDLLAPDETALPDGLVRAVSSR